MDRIEQLNEFLKKQPKDPFLRHALGLEYVKRGDLITAKVTFQELLKDQPDYVGSYYQLAKLLVELNEVPAAIKTYEEGMVQANIAGDRHSYGELRSALEELTF